MSVTDELLENNAAYAESFDKEDLPLPPARGVAVVACMDARLDVHKESVRGFIYEVETGRLQEVSWDPYRGTPEFGMQGSVPAR
jgi:carbonic anhydrase